MPSILNVRRYLARFLKTSNLFTFFLLFLLGIQGVVNIVGVLGPEISFDALWYHLTLPKLFLAHHAVFHIPGGVFYYSDMPKLVEMLYVVALALGNEIAAKFIHFAFGILTLFALYNLSRKFVSRELSFLILVIFYSNLVVGWETITAYTDLGRTFFEVMALSKFLDFADSKQVKYLYQSALMTGFAVTTKLLAAGSILIFSTLLLMSGFITKKKLWGKGIFTYWCTSILVVSPWLVFSYINMGNPMYPFFTSRYPVSLHYIFNISSIVRDIWILFTHSADPINPIYILTIPLTIVALKRFGKLERIIVIYAVLSILIWYITPRTGGGRFILPYLPAFSLLVVLTIAKMKEQWIKRYVIGLIVFTACVSIAYRAVANIKFVPVILGRESKGEFLTKNLHFDFEDFYDTDGYFARRIKQRDVVLIYGGHNLYYANFPFIHESYVMRGDSFDYILTQGSTLPRRFANWRLVYKNDITHVRLYSLGGKWVTY